MSIIQLSHEKIGAEAKKPLWLQEKVKTKITASLLGGGIPLEQATRLFTLSMLDAYIQNTERPPKGMSVIFNEVYKASLTIAVNTKLRGKVEAPYSDRGSQPHLAQNSKVNQDIYIAPYINLAMNLTEDQYYFQSPFGTGAGEITTEGQVQQLVEHMNREMFDIVAMIDRTVLRQMMNILQTGNFTFPDGTTISYGMPTSSTADVATIWNVPLAQQWQTAGQVEKSHLEIGRYLSREGQSAGGAINVWLGDSAWVTLAADPFFENRLNVEEAMVRLQNDPIADNNGNTPLGSATIGGRVFNYWGWEDTSTPFGDDPENATQVPYIGDSDAYFIASDFAGDAVYSGVPMLPEVNSNAVIERLRAFENVAGRGKVPFYFGDQMTSSQYWGFRAAPLIVPKSMQRHVAALGIGTPS